MEHRNGTATYFDGRGAEMVQLFSKILWQFVEKLNLFALTQSLSWHIPSKGHGTLGWGKKA